MKTQTVLRITETGAVECNPAYPVEPNENAFGENFGAESYFNSHGYNKACTEYEQACKEAESGFLPVTNKEYAEKWLWDNYPKLYALNGMDRTSGIYPYTGQVKHEGVNPCIEKKDCQLTGDDYRLACYEKCHKEYCGITLVEPKPEVKKYHECEHFLMTDVAVHHCDCESVLIGDKEYISLERFNTLQEANKELVEAMIRISNFNDLATAREHALEMITKHANL